MEKAEHEILTEVQRLASKKTALEKEIKSAERTLEIVQKNLVAVREEIAKQSAKLKSIVKDETEIRSELASERKSLEDGKKKLEESAERIDESFGKNTERLEEAKVAENRANEKLSTIKGKIKVLSDQNAVIASSKEDCEKNIADLKKADGLNREQASKRAIEIDRSLLKLKKEQEAVEAEKVKNNQDLERIKAEKSEALAICTKNRDESLKLKKREDAINAREQSCLKSEEENKASVVSNNSIKRSNEQEKKVIEVARLRIQKLSKEKGVDDELAKLRAEDEAK